MTCARCKVDCQRFGKHRNGLARFPGATPVPKDLHRSPPAHLGPDVLAQDKAELVVKLLIEGNSIRSTQRIGGVDQSTIMLS